jgi:hypothetical protein
MMFPMRREHQHNDYCSPNQDKLLTGGAYTSLADFEDDIDLLVHNAETFYAPRGKEIPALAHELQVRAIDTYPSFGVDTRMD